MARILATYKRMKAKPFFYQFQLYRLYRSKLSSDEHNLQVVRDGRRLFQATLLEPMVYAIPDLNDCFQLCVEHQLFSERNPISPAQFVTMRCQVGSTKWMYKMKNKLVF